MPTSIACSINAVQNARRPEVSDELTREDSHAGQLELAVLSRPGGRANNQDACTTPQALERVRYFSRSEFCMVIATKL